MVVNLRIFSAMVGQKNQILKVDNKSAITRLFDRKFGFFWNLEIGFKDSKYIPIFWDQIIFFFFIQFFRILVDL